jgi:hypothetical protein
VSSPTAGGVLSLPERDPRFVAHGRRTSLSCWHDNSLAKNHRHEVDSPVADRPDKTKGRA